MIPFLESRIPMSIFTSPEKKAEKIRQMFASRSLNADLTKTYFEDRDSAMKSDALLREHEKTSALFLAMLHRPSFLSHLLDACKLDASNVSENKNSLLYMALTTKNTMVGSIHQIIAHGVKLNAGESHVLDALAKTREDGLVASLIKEANADPNEINFLTRIVTESRFANLFQIAVNHGAKPELLHDQDNLIRQALKNDRDDSAYYLIEKKKPGENLQKLFDDGITCTKMPIRLYDLFLARGAKPEEFRDGQNGTLLHFACRTEDTNIFSDAMRLVKKGLIDINALTYNHDNALNLIQKNSSAYFYVDAIEKMIDAGIDTNRADSQYGNAIMHVLIEYCQDDDACQKLLQRLIDNDADIDACNKKKETPLHLAAQSGRLNIVKLLVRNDANTSLENVKGQTASETAQKAGHADVVQVLKGFSTDQNWQLLDKDRIAHTTIDAPIQKKITDIFNFAVQERITIIDDLNISTASTCIREPFDATLPAAVYAFKRYKALNGPINETEAFGSMKTFSGAPFLKKGTL